MEILTVDYNSENAGQKLVKSLHNTGFAVLKNHPIDYELVKKIFVEWKNFFNSKDKYNYPYDAHKGDGYVGIAQSEIAKGASKRDLKEFYHLYFPWGRYPKELSGDTISYYKQIFNLANQLLFWIEENSPQVVKSYFSKSLTSMVSRDRTLLRVLHYPPLNGRFDGENDGALRAAAHEDINLITLLPASDQTGLQVKTKDNNWLDVGTNAGEIVINVGDMLQECSNSYFLSTTHRVLNPIDTTSARMSLPLFLHPREDVFLSTNYPKAEHYLNERLAELGLLS